MYRQWFQQMWWTLSKKNQSERKGRINRSIENKKKEAEKKNFMAAMIPYKGIVQYINLKSGYNTNIYREDSYTRSYTFIQVSIRI